MIRTILSSAIVSFFTLPNPTQAEIASVNCKLSKYGDNPLTVIFPCEFRQKMGNVQVWSENWNFQFLAAEQGKSYVRINAKPLSFHRIGRYSLFVFQDGLPARQLPLRLPND